MSVLFVDTSYLIALEAGDDQYHQAAFQHWQALLESLPGLVTTSYVFDEVITFFNSRSHHSKAIEIGNRLLESPSVDLIHVDIPLFNQGWQYFKRYADKPYSLTDCISFVVMEKRRLSTALTFDRHFIQAGFEKLP